MEKAELNKLDSDVLRIIKRNVEELLKERAEEDKIKAKAAVKSLIEDHGLTTSEIDELMGRKKRLPTPTVVNLSNPSDITYSAGPKTPDWLQKMRNNSDYDRLDHARKSIPHLSGEALEKTKAFVAGKDEEAKAAAEKEAAKKK